MLTFLTNLRSRLGPLWWHTGLMLGISQIGNVLNLVIGVFLVPDVIGEDQLGSVLPLLQVTGFVAVPLSIVMGTGLKFVSFLQARQEHGRVKRLLKDMIRVALLLSIIVALYVWQSRGFIQARLRFSGNGIIWMVAGMAVVSCWLPLVQMAAQGLFRFYSLIVSSVVAPGVRLIAILLLLSRFQVSGYLAAGLIASASVVLFLGWSVRHSMADGIKEESYRPYWPEMRRYLLWLGAAVLVTSLQGVVEPWVIRQRLSEHESAGYYVVAMFGNIPAYVAPVMAPFLFPLVSARHATGQSTRGMHWQSLAVVLAIGGALILCFAVGGGPLLNLRDSWRTYAGFAPYVWQVALVTTLSAFVGIHTVHENACARFGYLWYYVPIILLETGLLYSFMGWGFFKPYLPAGMWAGVDRMIVLNLQFILSFMIAARVAICTGVFLQMLMRRHEPQGIRDAL